MDFICLMVGIVEMGFITLVADIQSLDSMIFVVGILYMGFIVSMADIR